MWFVPVHVVDVVDVPRAVVARADGLEEGRKKEEERREQEEGGKAKAVGKRNKIMPRKWGIPCALLYHFSCGKRSCGHGCRLPHRI